MGLGPTQILTLLWKFWICFVIVLLSDVARPLSYKTKTTYFFKTKTKTKTGQVKTKTKTKITFSRPRPLF